MRIFLAAILFCAFTAQAADRITASLVLTNTPVDGSTITINGNVRTWKTTVTVPATQILTNPVVALAKTNLYAQVGLNPITSVNERDLEATNIDYIGASGVPLTVVLSSGWGSLTYATQSVSQLTAVRVPTSGETAAVQTNVNSALVKALNDNSVTNPILATAPAVSATIVGISNAQTVVGAKTFSSGSGIWRGIVSNAPAITGVINRVTNGIFVSPISIGPTFTNGVNYGNAFSSLGNASLSEQFGNGSVALGIASMAAGSGAIAQSNNCLAIGPSAIATEVNAIAFGPSAFADATASNSIAIGTSAQAAAPDSVAIGYNTVANLRNQMRIGNASQYLSIAGGLQVDGNTTNSHFAGTNVFQAESDISFTKKALTTLANGINQDIIVGTNIFVQVSGPTGAFAIEGIAGGRDGKYLIILNKTTQDMTIACEGGATGNDPVAANRIITMTGADRVTTGNGAAILIYSASESRWQLIGFDP